MEQLFNIAWLLVVAGLVAITLARPHRPSHRNDAPYIVLVIVACIALLLFPAISVTDDLHPGSDLSDDAAWRHDKRMLGVFVFLMPLLLTPILVRQGTLSPRGTGSIASTHAGYLRLDAGRAPPRVS